MSLALQPAWGRGTRGPVLRWLAPPGPRSPSGGLPLHPRAQKDGATCWRLHCGQEGNPGLNHVRRPRAAFGYGLPSVVRLWLKSRGWIHTL